MYISLRWGGGGCHGDNKAKFKGQRSGIFIERNKM